MELKITHSFSGIDWGLIAQILEKVGMAHYDGETHRKAFENSHTAAFVHDGNRLVGFGRAISDGIYQAAIYDVAVLPEYQRSGAGSAIIKSIVERLPSCNIILYSRPGSEGFYEKLGFRKMKTGMALFTNPERMRSRGFTC